MLSELSKSSPFLKPKIAAMIEEGKDSMAVLRVLHEDTLMDTYALLADNN